MNALEIIRYLSNLSPLIPLYFVLAGDNRFKIKTINILGLLLLVSGLTDLSTYIMGAKNIDTAFMSNLYTLLEFILLALVYRELLPKHKNLIYLSIVIFVFFLLLDTLLIENLREFQGFTIAIEGVFLLIFSTLYYVQHMKQVNTPIPISQEISEKNLKESTRLYESIFNSTNYLNFWINSAVFFYFAMDMYLFIISSYVFTNEPAEIAMTFWSFHNACNIIKNVLFAVGIYYAGVKKIKLAH